MRLRAVLPFLLLVAACGGGGSSTTPDADPTSPDAEPDPDADPGPDGPPPTGLVECPTAVPPASEGSCDVTAGTGTAVVVRGNVLADGATYRDGEVVYDGDRIACVGCDCSDTAGYADATVIACAGAAVSPGLVNAHSHLNYDERPPLAATTTRYEHRHGWRGTVSTPNNQHGTGRDDAGQRWAELRHLINGTTSIAASTRANNLVRNLDVLETRDFDAGFDNPTMYEVFALGDGNEQFHPDCTWSYELTEFQVLGFQGLVTHTAEGIDDYAQEEFRCQSRSAGTAEDFVEKNVGHIHGVGLTAADHYNMVRDDAKLVWSPRSNISLYGNTAQAQVHARLGGTIALGTDWSYSGSATLVREMACVAELDDGWLGDSFTAEDIWRMGTIHGAEATGQEALIGSLEAGKLADLAVFRAAPGEYHAATIDAMTDDVLLVTRAGAVMYGEADVVEALDATCETLDVCGAPRRVCAMRELGVTYASIAAAVASGTPGYPTVLCEVPDDEPTCLPSRPGEYAGPTAEDPDGDGVTTGDNCPDVFNPIRPMDDGAQADVDGDGVGDACDPTPVGDDLDMDGTGNETDVCPFDAGDQADADLDGKGDACDECDDQPNATTVCLPPPDSIVEIQDGTLPEGAAVLVTGAVVTGVAYNGFSIQDPTVTSGEHAGVFVYTGGAPTVELGDVVAVTGTIDEFFELTELVDAAVLAREPGGTVPAPIALTVAQAVDERWESVLVTLTDVATVDAPFDCGCGDDQVFEINDAILAWGAMWPGTATEWDAEAATLAAGEPVTGVMFYRFDRRRIMPRSAADIGD